jgi:rootletin
LNSFLVDVRQQKELCIREINELKTQLKMVEDMRDNIRRELLDSNRRTRELEEELELHRKEINELKRYLNDEVREKELVINSNEDLRNKLKACENDKTDLNRLVDECKQRILGFLTFLSQLFINLLVSYI